MDTYHYLAITATLILSVVIPEKVALNGTLREVELWKSMPKRYGLLVLAITLGLLFVYFWVDSKETKIASLITVIVVLAPFEAKKLIHLREQKKLVLLWVTSQIPTSIFFLWLLYIALYT